MQEIALIVPCHNEENRLSPDNFNSFLAVHNEYHLFFVNDGSHDKTGQIIMALESSNPRKVTALHLARNIGKAEAIRHGVLSALQSAKYNYFGYVDADLATSLDEFHLLAKRLSAKEAGYIIGSRIRMMNTVIERSSFRHFLGRIIATVIDTRFRLGIYDTQCGAKCFKAGLAPVFNTPFATKWLFDVEILLRIAQEFPDISGIEQPLGKWSEPGSSKLNIFNTPQIMKEIIVLFNRYRRSSH